MCFYRKENEMPLTSVTKDPAQLTLTVVADFPVAQQRLWDAYADPRQLERFWGRPPGPPPSRVMISRLAVALSTS
jgi:hypothetical protein